MTQQQIGRYTIIEEIGQGGFATVFRALDTTLEREVAIKVMRPMLMGDPEFVIRFQREAKVAASLQHPNIVPIYDYGEHEGRLFLVMKLLQGSLATRLEQGGAVPWAEAVALMQQAAAGLDYAHQRGVIHRDIKPDNILLDKNGSAVVADFGVVKAMERSTVTMSMSGGILGTPAYVAPEVWNDEDVTPATDEYALACVLYEIVTGQQLFTASTPPATMALHFRELQLPAVWPDGVPPGLSDVLRRALAREPGERLTTAGDFAHVLSDLTQDPLAERYAVLQTAIAGEKWTDAVALAEAILAQNATYKDTTVLLRQATERQMIAQQAIQAVQWREQAEQAVAAGNWQMALTAIQRWQQTTPNDPAAQQLLEQLQLMVQPQPAPVPNIQTKETTSAKKEQKAIQGWAWFAIGAVVVLLLFLFGSQLIGKDENTTAVEQPATVMAVIANVTDTPPATTTNTPTPRPTNTLEPTAINTSTPRPTNTLKPTTTSTSTPRPTNTVRSTVASTQLNTPSLASVLSVTPSPAVHNTSSQLTWAGCAEVHDSILLYFDSNYFKPGMWIDIGQEIVFGIKAHAIYSDSLVSQCVASIASFVVFIDNTAVCSVQKSSTTTYSYCTFNITQSLEHGQHFLTIKYLYNDSSGAVFSKAGYSGVYDAVIDFNVNNP